MTVKNVFLILLKCLVVYTYIYQKPIPAKLWSEHCQKNSLVLNDCNVCRCDSNHKYKCQARVCSQVDMFGHFNDAIKDIDGGMEGHGVWRSTNSACSPGVYYRRGAVLCICNEDGQWPNPVCRDTFRILYPVEVTTGIEISQKCIPRKLYLFGCNACLCPSTSVINSEFCTKHTCSKDDPILNVKDVGESEEKTEFKDNIIDGEEFELYAMCDTNKKYSHGYQTCTCLRNNRLLCDNCTSTGNNISYHTKPKHDNLCSNNKPGYIFNMDCNHCFCDSKSLLYCTTKKCIKTFSLNEPDVPNQEFQFIEAPMYNHECTIGTKYEMDCNICYCFERNNEKYFSCTMEECGIKNTLRLNTNDCVIGTEYEMNCLICHCDFNNGIKRQTCKVNSRCIGNSALAEIRTKSLGSLHGYCEPLHVYTWGCNTCQCQSNGKIVACTTRICEQKRPLVIDLIPVKPKHPDYCPKGMSYKLDCNVCFCLDNGNAVCTTNDCEDESVDHAV